MKFVLRKGEARLKRTTGENRRLLRYRVFLRDDWRCFWCGVSVDLHAAMQLSPRAATIDHIIPASCGGGNVDENLVTSCNACNNARDNRPAEAWLCEVMSAASRDGKKVKA